MGSYDDLRNIMQHIADISRNKDAWKTGLSPQEVRDVEGWLKSEHTTDKGTGQWQDCTGWTDPQTGVFYRRRNDEDNSGDFPQVPDNALDRIRNAHPGLFNPSTKEMITPPHGPGQPAPPAPAPAETPAPGEGLSTDEENSGRAQKAIDKVKAELADRKSNVHDADAKLTELMLTSKAKQQDGLTALQGMQQDIVAALNDPASNLDTPDGELQFLKMLRDKADTARDLLNSGKLADADQAKMALALADFYKQGNNNSNGPGQGQQPPGQTDLTDPRLTNPVAPGLMTPDPSEMLGPPPEMPGPLPDDLGLGNPLGPGSPLGDGLSAAAPLLQGLNPGGLLGGGGGGLDVGAITKPIGDAISAAAEHSKPDDDAKPGDDHKPKPDEKPDKPEGPPTPKPDKPEGPPTSPPEPAPGTLGPNDPPAPPTAPSMVVDLKDGSHVTATDLSRAEATRAALKGTPAGEAYRVNNLSFPPPGTRLTTLIPPNQLVPADYAMYTDKVVMMLGPDKWVDEGGQIQPIKTLPQGPSFLGYGHPTNMPAAAPAPAPAPPAPGAGIAQQVASPQPAPPPPPQPPK